MEKEVRIKTLEAARLVEEEGMALIPAQDRPVFHLTPPTGWMNDPNGFSFYGGEYHLFFQYNPYGTSWDTMHWGHAVSRDLLRWEYRPAALAPDREYDRGGCFSGCAVTLPNGRQLLMYTGLMPDDREPGSQNVADCAAGTSQSPYHQVQNLAVGDGRDYVKYDGNPVIRSDKLPEECNPYDFRDPKILVRRDGTYLALLAGLCRDGLGEIFLYTSRDGFRWDYWKPLLKNSGRFGKMWECPDLFELDGKWFLMVSPMELREEEPEYHSGHGNIVLGGSFDEESGVFTPDYDQSLDYGIDFYAAQTLQTEDGRRVMIGWMQNWAAIEMRRDNARWNCQMSMPRELSFHDGRLYQVPIREIAQYYDSEVFYKKVPVSGQMSLYGVDGRTIDMEVRVQPAPGEPVFGKFSIWFAMDEDNHTALEFFPAEGRVFLDRSFSGARQAVIHRRGCQVPESRNGELTIRILLDRFSAEIFLNDGRYVLTAILYTDLSADRISFCTDGQAVIDVARHGIRK